MDGYIIELLLSGGYSCVIRQGKDIHTFTQKGVADLYQIYKHRTSLLDGACIADKVVGKGAAALMVLGEVKAVYADVISSPALSLLREAGIETSFRQKVHHIENRAKNGWCPLETICYLLDSVSDIYSAIERFVNKENTVV